MFQTNRDSLDAITSFGYACFVLDYLDNESEEMNKVLGKKTSYSSKLVATYAMRIMGYSGSDMFDLFHGMLEYRPEIFLFAVNHFKGTEKAKELASLCDAYIHFFGPIS